MFEVRLVPLSERKQVIQSLIQLPWKLESFEVARLAFQKVWSKLNLKQIIDQFTNSIDNLSDFIARVAVDNGVSHTRVQCS
jgi:hypothetical protein